MAHLRWGRSGSTEGVRSSSAPMKRQLLHQRFSMAVTIGLCVGLAISSIVIAWSFRTAFIVHIPGIDLEIEYGLIKLRLAKSGAGVVGVFKVGVMPAGYALLSSDLAFPDGTSIAIGNLRLIKYNGWDSRSLTVLLSREVVIVGLIALTAICASLWRRAIRQGRRVQHACRCGYPFVNVLASTNTCPECGCITNQQSPPGGSSITP